MHSQPLTFASVLVGIPTPPHRLDSEPKVKTFVMNENMSHTMTISNVVAQALLPQTINLREVAFACQNCNLNHKNKKSYLEVITRNPKTIIHLYERGMCKCVASTSLKNAKRAIFKLLFKLSQLLHYPEYYKSEEIKTNIKVVNIMMKGQLNNIIDQTLIHRMTRMSALVTYEPEFMAGMQYRTAPKGNNGVFIRIHEKNSNFIITGAKTLEQAQAALKSFMELISKAQNCHRRPLYKWV